jgi:hypothetical protein
VHTIDCPSGQSRSSGLLVVNAPVIDRTRKLFPVRSEILDCHYCIPQCTTALTYPTVLVGADDWVAGAYGHSVVGAVEEIEEIKMKYVDKYY